MPATTQAVLRISGSPGAKYRLLPRTRGDEDVAEVATGVLDATGNAIVTIPNGNYVLLSDGYASIPVLIDGTLEVISVDFLPER